MRTATKTTQVFLKGNDLKLAKDTFGLKNVSVSIVKLDDTFYVTYKLSLVRRLISTLAFIGLLPLIIIISGLTGIGDVFNEVKKLSKVRYVNLGLSNKLPETMEDIFNKLADKLNK